MPDKNTRHGTLTDAQMRSILDPKQRLYRRETYQYGPAIFLNLWVQYAGLAEEIKLGEPAADKLLELCANDIAHPDDLWPVLWALANDGKDAPEIPPAKKTPQSEHKPSS